MDSNVAQRLMHDAEVVILEFEGVVCNATGERFGAARILAALAKRYRLPLNLLDSRDEFELLVHLDSKSTEVAECGDREAAEMELESVRDATCRPGVKSLLRLVKDSGRKSACIARMCASAVDQFLDLNDICELFNVVVGRPKSLGHMIPHPHAFHTALYKLGVAQPEKAVFVAWSEAAAAAAKNIRMPVVHYDSGWNRIDSTVAMKVRSLAQLGRHLGDIELDESEGRLQRRMELSAQRSMSSAEMRVYGDYWRG